MSVEAIGIDQRSLLYKTKPWAHLAPIIRLTPSTRVLGLLQTSTGATVPTHEENLLQEGRRFFYSLRTYFIVMTERPNGLAQIDQGGFKSILVWSSRRKAKDFAISQGLKLNKHMIERLDLAMLREFALRVGRDRVVLDYKNAPGAGPFIGVVLTEMSVN